VGDFLSTSSLVTVDGHSGDASLGTLAHVGNELGTIPTLGLGGGPAL